MSKIKISKPERLPKEGITDVDFLTWKNELENYLNQDDNFQLFTARGVYSTWVAAEIDDRRLLAPKGHDANADLPARRRLLNNFLTITAGCCYKDHYMTIIQQATSFEWIWQEIKNIYQITHRGKDFLNIVDIKWDASTMTATSVYNAYRSKILENLKPKDTLIKWKNTTTATNEVLSPTFEDHILLSVLQLIDNRLPAKVREIYGPRMENERFLMDFKQDILGNVAKMLDDLDATEVQINAINQQFNRTRFSARRNNYRNNDKKQFIPNNSNNKFCRLCHTSRRPRSVVTTHEIGDLDCPSLSERDKNALRIKGIATAPVLATPMTEEEELAEIARAHGYDDNQPGFNTELGQSLNNDQVHLSPTNYIAPVPSQILTLYQNEKVIHLDLDSGSWVSCVKADFVTEMNWKIYPNGQLAKLADNKTVLKSVGEIHETFTRNNWSVTFDALVLPNLHTNAIGGNNFMKDNNIEQKISSKNIIVHNKFIVPETNRNVPLPTHLNNLIVSSPINKVILPQQDISLSVPLPDKTQVTVEPRASNNLDWPTPQICTVTDGKIIINNNTNQPVRPTKNKHEFQLRAIETKNACNPEPGYAYTQQHKQPQDYSNDITINLQIMNQQQQQRVETIINNNKATFNKDLSEGYNHHAGKHYCRLNWANKERPKASKVICPSYNSALNSLLQDVCDELTDNNVLGVPQDDGIIVQCISPCFLRRKQKAKDKPMDQLTKDDVRLVVNTNFLGQHLKNIPSKITKPQEVYAALSRWKYIIKTDLYQGFFQNHLHPEAYQWCAIQTPFGGMRYFKRSIQGLVGQTEEQDENLSKVLHQLLKTGKCVKIADDILAGGSDIDEAITNFELLVTTLNNNNLKISPSKTYLFPKQVDILSWVWNQGGYLTPSPHRKQALADIATEDIKTIKDMRSWIGLFKTFADCTPNLTAILDPFDTLVGGKDSKDTITWTPLLTNQFTKAKLHINNMTDMYLPQPDDQLIITCDGARTPPAVGMVLQAKNNSGVTKTVRYYSVKLKNHHLKWFPCELEAVALGTAVEAFYEYIKNSNKPVIICPDSKAVVDAAKKIAKGQFSLSPRIQTFLNNLGKIRHDIQHISGKSGHNAAGDFQSRSASTCSAELCQICSYVNNNADTIINVKLNAVTENNNADAMPFLNRTAWKSIQDKDKACIQAKTCLSTGQTPSKKSGKANVESRRIFDKAAIAKDGLLVVKQTIPLSTTKLERIVIPTAFLDSLLSQLHIKFQHPAKSQMNSIFAKYFFAHGASNAIDQLYDSCQTCKASQILPKQLQTYTTQTNAKQPGTHFGVDVLKRAKQKIIVCTDQFSTFVTAAFIEDETKDSLKNGIIKTTQAIRHPGQITVRVDAAAGFKSLNIADDTDLKNLNIILEIGDPLNKNSNACVDKSIAELNHELRKLVQTESPINEATLSKAVLSLNNKLRRNGQLSSSSILFARDRLTNTNLHINDATLAADQLKTRLHNNNNVKTAKPAKHQQLQPGDIVMQKDNPKKHKIRDSFIITTANKSNIIMQKVRNNVNQRANISNVKYNIKPNRLMKVNNSNPYSRKKTATTCHSNWSPFRDNESSDSDTNSETDDDQYLQQQHQEDHVQPDQRTSDDDAQNNFFSAEDEEEGHEQGAIRKPPREIWLVKRTSSRAAAKHCKKRLKSIATTGTINDSTSSDEDPEILRVNQISHEYVVSSAEATRAHTPADHPITDDNNEDIQQPSLDWDDYQEATSPTFLHDIAFTQEPDEYPTSISPGRVYNFDHLPPLPISITSPPSQQQQPITSTPAPKQSKRKKVIKKLGKMFH